MTRHLTTRRAALVAASLLVVAMVSGPWQRSGDPAAARPGRTIRDPVRPRAVPHEPSPLPGVARLPPPPDLPSAPMAPALPTQRPFEVRAATAAPPVLPAGVAAPPAR